PPSQTLARTNINQPNIQISLAILPIISLLIHSIITSSRALKDKINLSNRPISVLGNRQLNRQRITRTTSGQRIILSPQKHHHVGVLLNRSRITKVRQLWRTRLFGSSTLFYIT